ncbi:MAG: ABC transporter permease [Gemmatimonadaceae bacterium]
MTLTIDPASRSSAPVGAPPLAPRHASRGEELPVVVIDGSTHWSRWVADVRQYRGALYSLAWRNVRSRYKQAVLGMSWALLQPAIQVGVFTVLFGIIARVPSANVPYPLFALAGLLPWNLFARVVSEGSQSLVTNQHIVTKLFFPRIFLVLAAGASAFIDAAVTAGLLAVFMIVYGVAPDASIGLLIPAFVGLALFAYGFGALLAAINARWRDVQHTVPFLLQIGLFLTPVLYPALVVPERLRWLAALNPLTGWIGLFRSSVLGAPMPDAAVLIQSIAISVAITVLGFWYFARSERTIVDVV